MCSLDYSLKPLHLCQGGGYRNSRERRAGSVQAMGKEGRLRKAEFFRWLEVEKILCNSV